MTKNHFPTLGAARLARTQDANADRDNPAKVAATLALQGVAVSLLPGDVLHFADVETFLRLRVTMPELGLLKVRTGLKEDK